MGHYMHTAQCTLNYSKWMRLKAEYIEKWPDYCTTCAGWGSFSYDYDPSPSGVSLGGGHMTDAEPCGNCCEKGKCPRCAAELLILSNPALCLQCGWIGEKTVGIPEAPDCFCYEQYA